MTQTIDVFSKHMFKYDEFSSEIDQKLKFTTLHPKKSQQNFGIMLVIINLNYNTNNILFRIPYLENIVTNSSVQTGS